MKHPAVGILEELVRIQSVNPHYGEGARGEQELSRYVEAYFARLGLSVRRQQVAEGRDNVIVELKTGHPDSLLLFEAHMDTVSLGSMEQPLVPVIRDGRLYGRGACDTKGSLAAMMYAFEQCARRPEGLQSDLVLCASVDEEHAFTGLLKFLELELPVTAAVVGEPTELKIVVSHKGCARFAVRTGGRAAHSSVPHEGVNAIVGMAKVIGYVNDRLAPTLTRLLDPLCGPATISIGTIRGGKQINIVPESCVIEVDRRIIPGEQPEQVLSEIREELLRWCAEEGIDCTIEPLLLDWALNTPQGDPLVLSAQKAAASLGLADGLYGETYGSNASKLQGIRGIPSIVYGPGSIAQAHSREEWVGVRDVEQAARFYEQLARSYRRS
ncbi:acetylornithine deacetylase [Paenibacillus sp. UNCCL117]|uniref:M20 family metallopeptidase n=1 Tax=unclassified Paenibacillus TaxID=185978 RepID=UPI0008871C2F|nr:MULTISPECIES: M20 family metallopeptidase [unclassified Paenibacillus]SDE10416.1 acetylornithine deacetylase [Paenibacillus sp. cl123]SFW59761.1 acetylornithine deacetylase [Paenibacillus sp. UNCCL117]